MNPMQIINMFLGGKTPEECVMAMVNNNTNPLLANLIQMAKKGDKKGVEQFARNLFKEQGKDFDSFIRNLK